MKNIEKTIVNYGGLNYSILPHFRYLLQTNKDKKQRKNLHCVTRKIMKNYYECIF